MYELAGSIKLTDTAHKKKIFLPTLFLFSFYFCILCALLQKSVRPRRRWITFEEKGGWSQVQCQKWRRRTSRVGLTMTYSRRYSGTHAQWGRLQRARPSGGAPRSTTATLALRTHSPPRHGGAAPSGSPIPCSRSTMRRWHSSTGSAPRSSMKRVREVYHTPNSLVLALLC